MPLSEEIKKIRETKAAILDQAAWCGKEIFSEDLPFPEEMALQCDIHDVAYFALHALAKRRLTMASVFGSDSPYGN